MVIVIRGQRYWLWRGVDNEGEVLDFLVQSKRNAKAALKLMRKLLKKQGWPPTRITTDKLRSYHVAIRTLGLTAQHIDDRRANNRAENSHQPVRRRERKQQRFKSPGSAQRFLNIQSAVYNTSTRTPMNSTKKRSMSWVIRWKREARRALPGREASRARSEALSRVRRSQPTGADRFAVLDDHLRAGVLNAPRTRNASRCRTERRTSTRQQRALRRACQLAEVAVDSVRRDLRHHQTQVSRRCTDGCTGAAPQLERTSGWGL